MNSASDDPTISRDGVTYTVIPLESCIDLGTGLHQAGKKWHMHVLPPGCGYNPYTDRYAMVIEDDTEHRAYIAESDVFPEVDKTLVQLLHGNDILDPSKTAAATGAKSVASQMLDHVRELEKRGIPWHHHMNFPDCLINPHPRRWAITIESAEGRFFETYDSEPIDVLRELEVIHFSHLEKRHD